MNGSQTVRTLAKPGVVIAGYAVAFLVAYAVVSIRDLHQSAQAQASPGMYAWGDLILFAEVFGLVAIIPTALALYLLRPLGRFWNTFSIVALVIAATGPVAVLMVTAGSQQSAQSVLGILAMFGALREMVSPPAAVLFILATFAAPAGRPRQILLTAAVIETAIGLYSFFRWFALFTYCDTPFKT